MLERDAHISAEMATPGELLVGQRLGPAGADRGKRPLGAAGLLQTLLPLGLQGPCDEPVLRLAAVELAACPLRFIGGALQLEFGRANDRLVPSVQVIDRAQRRVDRGRRERLNTVATASTTTASDAIRTRPSWSYS